MTTSAQKPIVTILCIAYNQKAYIAQALDSFLMQITDFELEIIVHDDASTDGTAEIIKAYDKAHPGRFTVINETKNQYSKTGIQFLEDMYKMARGKYIAICEGDDFWTDPAKLQEQVDVLEAHPEYSLVFHRVNIFTEGEIGKEFVFPDRAEPLNLTIEGLLERNFIQTNSVMYRRQKYADLPKNITPFDWYMHLYHAQFGQIGFIDKVMSAYRKHPGGLWWDTDSNIDQIWIKHGLAHLGLYAAMMRLYGEDPERHRIIERSSSEMIDHLADVDAKYGDNLLGQAMDKYPEAVRAYILDQKAHVVAAQATSAPLQPHSAHGVKGASKELLRALKRSARSRLLGP